MAPIDGYDWRVRVHNRSSGICRTLFTPGTATAATFPDAPAAVAAAIAAVTAAGTTAAAEQEGRAP